MVIDNTAYTGRVLHKTSSFLPPASCADTVCRQQKQRQETCLIRMQQAAPDSPPFVALQTAQPLARLQIPYPAHPTQLDVLSTLVTPTQAGPGNAVPQNNQSSKLGCCMMATSSTNSCSMCVCLSSMTRLDMLCQHFRQHSPWSKC